MTTGPALALILVPPLLTACAGDGRADELACQRRLVEVTLGGGRPSAALGAGRMAETFRAASERYRGLPAEGCTPAQQHSATAMAGLAAELADSAAQIGDPLTAMEQVPDLASSRPFLEFQNRLEQFERRRQVIREDLERMAAER